MSRNNYIKRISRKLYNDCIDNTDAVKAISMLIYLKENKKCSVIKNFSYRKICDATTLSIVVVKKRMNKLNEMGLLEIIDNNKIKFGKIRAPKSNVRLDKIDMSSVSSIEIGLRALYIIEVQRRKEYVKSAVNLTDKSRNMNEYKKAKNIQRQVLRGTKSYTDNGISYNYLCNKLHISKQTVKIIINYGISNKIFNKNRNFYKLKDFNNQNEAYNAYNYFKGEKGRLRVVGYSLCLIMANTYNIL